MIDEYPEITGTDMRNQDTDMIHESRDTNNRIHLVDTIIVDPDHHIAVADVE